MFIEWNLKKVSEQKSLAEKLFAVGAVAAVKFACKYDEHTEADQKVFDEKYETWAKTGEVQ